MFMTFVEIKHGLLAMVGLGAGLFVLLMLISGVHLLLRETGRGIRRRMHARATSSRKQAAKDRLYVGAGD
jgi:UPF0716 family protein affecting phage T7 exclusion